MADNQVTLEPIDFARLDGIPSLDLLSPARVSAYQNEASRARAALAAMDRESGGGEERKAFIRLLDAADRYNGIHTQTDKIAGPYQGKLILAVQHAYRVLGIGRTEAQPAPRPVEDVEVTQISADVAELVIAARELVFSDHRPVGSPETQAEVELIELFDSLDKATEAFSERIPWHNEPETETRHRQQSLSAARAEIEGHVKDFRWRANQCRTNNDAFDTKAAYVWDLAADALEKGNG